MSFFPSRGDQNCMHWRLFVIEYIAKTAKLRKPFFLGFNKFFLVLTLLFGFGVWVLVFWQTSLLCKLGEFKEGGSVAVAVGVGDR